MSSLVFPLCTSAFAMLLLLAPAPTLAAGPALSLSGDQVLQGRFVHDHPVQGFDKPIRSEGTFSVTAKDKIVWSIERPMATTTTITPSGLVQSVGTYPLLRLTPEKMPFLAHVQQSLLWALSGQWDKLKKDYDVKTKGDDAKWEVTITPKDNAASATAPKPFRTITARGSRYVEEAVILLKNGATDHVTFSDVTLGAP